MSQGQAVGFRLSPQQKRLWLLQQREAEQPYRLVYSATIAGAIDPRRLDQAIRDALGRYEIFRTTFQCLPGVAVPLQFIADAPAAAVASRDLRGCDAAAHAREDAAQVCAGRARRFDLERGPLCALALDVLAPDRAALYLSAHPLIADAPTLRTLLRAIAGCYVGAAEPDEAPMQYADIAEWHNELLESADAEAGRAFWRACDLGALAALRLPGQLSPAAPDFRPELLGAAVAPERAAAIRALAERHATTPAIVLLACWQALLHRLSGQPDLIIGMACDGRMYQELEAAPGLLARAIPLRCQLDPTMRFDQLLAQTAASASEAIDWQEYFTWPAELDGDAPAFPWGFDFEEQAPPETIGGLSLALRRRYACLERFALWLAARDDAGALALELHYDARLFAPETIARLSEQLQLLLDGVLRDPTGQLDAFAILGAAERDLLLRQFNATDAPYALAPIHQLVAAQARRTPDHVAVTFEDQQLSYAQLEARAAWLARQLGALGVGPEVPVALCVERSIELLVGVLAVLKAGGAYVPLDPAYPRERLALIMDELRPPVLLTQARLRAGLPPHSAHAIALDVLDWPPDGAPSAPYDGGARPEHLAYVIYTSGSTGRPKGVMVTHASICNRLLWGHATYPLGPDDRVLQAATYSFDFSVWELFAPLISGARVVMIRPDGHQDCAYLVDLIAERGVTTAHFVPSMLQLLLEESEIGRCTALRRLFSGGEALSPELQARCFARLGADLLNQYGPTEAAVDVTFWPCVRADPGAPVPIGRPVANTRLYVLDRQLQPTPIGVAGELHIGGVQLARGYLGRADLTAERFIPNPFAQVLGDRGWVVGDEDSAPNTQHPTPNTRLYRTGDLARFRADGAVEYLGRIDHQVKVRGFRIELGEIEAVLRRHPAVRQAVVSVQELAAGHRRLVAYVVPATDDRRPTTDQRPQDDHRPPTTDQRPAGDPADSSLIARNSALGTQHSELIAFLRERLPDYMVPSAFVTLAALPLLPSGKVDLRALPAPDQTRPDLAQDYVAPRTPSERALAEIWAQVLGVDRVGVNDNFFDLGGDSLQVIRVVSLAGQAGLAISARQLFEHSTIAGLAAVIETAVAVPIRADQELITGPLPFSPIQVRFLTREGFFSRLQYWGNGPLLEAREPLDPELLAAVTRQLILHHDILRLRLRRTEDRWEQLIAAPDERTPFVRIDLSGRAELEQGYHAVEAAVIESALRLLDDLDLAEGPLFRVIMYDLGAGKPHYLLPFFHYPTADVASWQLVVEDLLSAYQQARRGDPIRLPPKTTAFSYFTQQLHAYAMSDELRRELDYWLSEARQRAPGLPVDHQQGPNTVASFGAVTIALSPEETQALRQVISKDIQIRDVLLTATLRAVLGWSGQRALLVDMESHGRETPFADVDLARTVGWHTAIFPMLFDLEPGADPRAALESVKAQIRAIPSKGLGYGVLRYLTGDEQIIARLEALPHPDLVFNYLGEIDRVIGQEQAPPEGALLRLCGHIRGYMQDQDAARPHLLNVLPYIAAGQLHTDWLFSENLHRRATIEALAHDYADQLRAMIAAYSASERTERPTETQEPL